MKKCVLFLSLLLVSAISSAATIVVSSPEDEIVRSSTSSTVVTEVSPGIYEYNFTVNNTSDNYLTNWGGDAFGYTALGPFIVDFEIPIYSLDVLHGGLANVASPANWAVELLTSAEYFARFGQDSGLGSDYILHWYDEGFTDPMPSTAIAPSDYILPGGTYNGEPVVGDQVDVHMGTLDGFIIQSTYAPVDGPYSTSWALGAWNIGDPPLPGGMVGGGGVPGVPIPPAISMFTLGLIMLFRKATGKSRAS
jgi:hypothetical protein